MSDQQVAPCKCLVAYGADVRFLLGVGSLMTLQVLVPGERALAAFALVLLDVIVGGGLHVDGRVDASASFSDLCGVASFAWVLQQPCKRDADSADT